MKALRIAGVVLGILLISGLTAGTYLLSREEIPEETNYRIDLQALRDLATSLPGDLPLRINHELIARAHLPRAAVFAGESFDPHPMVHGAYQILYDGHFVLVDAGMGPAEFAEMAQGDDDIYNELGWKVLTAAMEQAEAIVLTHEHSDHLDGIVAHPAPEKIAPRVKLNREQLAAPRIGSDLRSQLRALEYEQMIAIAPGVVLLRAAGHTPGSQMIFVKLQDSREWLLVGDVAWHMDQIRNLHYRPRLVTDLVLGEDRDAVMAQLRALHDLMQAEPNLLVVSSHDEDQRTELVRSGRLGERFE